MDGLNSGSSQGCDRVVGCRILLRFKPPVLRVMASIRGPCQLIHRAVFGNIGSKRTLNASVLNDCSWPCVPVSDDGLFDMRRFKIGTALPRAMFSKFQK